MRMVRVSHQLFLLRRVAKFFGLGHCHTVAYDSGMILQVFAGFLSPLFFVL